LQNKSKWREFSNEELGALLIALRSALTKEQYSSLTGSLFPKICKIVSELAEEVVERNIVRKPNDERIEVEEPDPNAGS